VASIVRYQPFRFPLAEVSRDFDRVFDRIFDDAFGARRPAAAAANSANLFETQESYWVELPLPGVRPEDVEVTVQENVLSLKAKRAWEAPQNSRAIWQGFSQGEWRQSFTLPGEVNPERVAATLEHGVLRLELPKAEHMKPRTIRVNAGSQPTITAHASGPASAEAPAAETANGEAHAS
jgi:HSP20 family protein